MNQLPDMDKGDLMSKGDPEYNDFDSYVMMVQDYNRKMDHVVKSGQYNQEPHFGGATPTN